jgi:hypothetical protein
LPNDFPRVSGYPLLYARLGVNREHADADVDQRCHSEMPFLNRVTVVHVLVYFKPSRSAWLGWLRIWSASRLELISSNYFLVQIIGLSSEYDRLHGAGLQMHTVS